LIEPRRPARYERIYAQLRDLIEGQSPDLVAAMATMCAVLHHKMPQLILLLSLIPLLARSATAAGPPPEPCRVVEIEVVGEHTAISVVDRIHHTRAQVAREPFAVMPAPMFEKFVALSPDGRQVAYVTADDLMMRNARLWLVDADGANRRLLATFPRDFWVAPLAWAPDSRRLAFVRVGQDDGLELWALDTRTGAQSLVLADSPLRPQLFYGPVSDPVRWSADGLRLVDVDSSTASSSATLPCSVPLFAQNDPRWRDEVMQTCGLTIGQAGCALTSAAMAFNYYGASTDPPTFNTCLGDHACPLYWIVAADKCSDGRVTWMGGPDFSWSLLEQELTAGRPPLLAMHKESSHYVVVVSGSGSDPAGYTVHDPWDAQVRSLADFSAWSFERLSIYGGEPWCGWPPEPPILLEPIAGANLGQRTITFRWQPSVTPDVDGYTLRLNRSADPDEGPQIADTSLVSQTVEYIFTFEDDGNYHWHMRAWKEERPSAWASRSFVVDTNPPASSVTPLSPTMESNYFTVRWSGSDALSGLADYDIQFREGAAGTWTDWLTSVVPEEGWFLGVTGQAYYFQSRARDHAGNQEAYPGGEGDTHTTIAHCEADGYEGDDGPASANPLAVGGPTQQHNFCGVGDEDWFAFDATEGEAYLLRVLNLGPYTDVALTLYGADGQTVLADGGGAGAGVGYWLAWTALADGRYYGRARHAVDGAAGSALTYEIIVVPGHLAFLPLVLR
jgi:hypothetical protein